MRVQVIPVNDDDPVAFATLDGRDGSTEQLRALQHIIGGYIEMVTTHPLNMKKNCMLVDEDGRDKGKTVNRRAMQLSGYAGLIVGTAVIAGLEQDSEGGLNWGNINE